MKSKTLKIIAITIGILGVSALGYSFLSSSKTSKVEVKTVAISKGDVITTVTATGTVAPITQVEVGTQVSGVVEKIYVDYNSEVTEGQLIAELDKTNLKAAVVQSRALYDNALNEKNYLQTIFDRQKQLYDSKVISKSDYDEALYKLNTANSTVTQRQSELNRAQTDLGFANIYSPIDGVVLSRDVDEGQTVAASYSTPTLFTIAKNLEEMQVEANVDEADIGQVKEGQSVTFTVDAYQDDIFKGVVTQVRLNPTTTSNVVTYTVVIRANNPDLKLKPGLTASVSIYTLELKDVLTAEAKAINFKPNMETLHRFLEENNIEKPAPQGPPPADTEGTIVWVYKPNGDIVPTAITLGASDGIHVQILEGLEPGDNLVYSLKATGLTEEAAPMPEENSSPFMPKPPGKKK
ncbi:efflux RND transporter periplasmic adaptor subunit [Mangrovimonas xylaniphaga]|uniref:efflux RND transporter periplasmic adaptor subunit n=1 Tax=Mangrovimonas xylaniphaga TaxID=1645915 RepID=UPI0006B65771|nr:efflux RND transporter periplasmic adaptor subunit [Mangrovimonas xylaniphaga]